MPVSWNLCRSSAPPPRGVGIRPGANAPVCTTPSSRGCARGPPCDLLFVQPCCSSRATTLRVRLSCILFRARRITDSLFRHKGRPTGLFGHQRRFHLADGLGSCLAAGLGLTFHSKDLVPWSQTMKDGIHAPPGKVVCVSKCRKRVSGFRSQVSSCIWTRPANNPDRVIADRLPIICVRECFGDVLGAFSRLVTTAPIGLILAAQ
jgi:hypothetical protein